jgi:hypothetical protein
VNSIVREAVELFYAELKYLAENTKADVLICAVPQVLLDITQTATEATEQAEEDGEKAGETPAESQLNFHHMLKARAMDLNIPIQLIIPSTYDKTKGHRLKRHPDLIRRTQDEATRAWNLHTALYYKAKGVPWRLLRDPSEFTTCYVGVSFYKTLEGSALLTSVAQVFNERGQGVVVRGGPAKVSKDDRQVHLEEHDAHELLARALTLYRDEHKTFPARVVIHKSSTYTKAEIDGFMNAAKRHNIEMADLLSVDQSFSRLFRVGSYPPLRGTFLSLDERLHILYTKGSVDFFSTYPGMYVPRPLLFRCEYAEQTPKFLAREILALTKMNWNNTQFDGGMPITMRASYQVGNILKYIDKDGYIASAYRFYM